MDKITERFLKYVKIETRSDENSTSVPSTPTQTEFLKMLARELEEIGYEDIYLNPKNSYLTATVPSNIEKDVPTIGFIAHVDTADFNAKNISPKIHENYDGKDIILNKEKDIVLSVKEFPNLKKYIGETLITTDGNTLLGSDDKSGVAEIVTVGEYLINHPEFKHGKIRFAWGPDEEIGTGATRFDVEGFGCDFAYTVDGGPVGELECESFNAAYAKIHVKGMNVHPGTAKDIMINALEVTREFQNKLPDYLVPEKTEGREGFYHLLEVNGTVDEASFSYIIRDHNRDLFEEKKAYMKKIAEELNKEFGKKIITIDMKDEYYNMYEVIKKDKRTVDIAEKAMKELNITPIMHPIRGGTDGSIISFKGLPTPNLFAGGENFHGRYEFVSTEAMKKAYETVIKIIELVEKNS